MTTTTERRMENEFNPTPSGWAAELRPLLHPRDRGRIAITKVATGSTWKGSRVRIQPLFMNEVTVRHERSHRASQRRAVGQTSLSGRQFRGSRPPLFHLSSVGATLKLILPPFARRRMSPCGSGQGSSCWSSVSRFAARWTVVLTSPTCRRSIWVIFRTRSVARSSRLMIPPANIQATLKPPES